MNFAAALLASPAAAVKTALLTRQGDVSYGRLRHRAAQVAAYLQAQDLAPGDRVLLAAEPSLFWVECYLGIALAGGVSVPLAAPSDPDFTSTVMTGTSPRAACVQSSWLRRFPALPTECTTVLSEARPARGAENLALVTTAEIDTGSEPEPVPAAAGDLAVINFTSGSTGTPRGVMVSHGNILANTADIITSLDIGPDDRVMSVLPLHYCYGASLLHTHLLVGASVVIDNRFLFPDKILQNLIDTACTTLAGVPSTYQILLRRSSLPKMSFPQLKKLQQAGGHLPAAFIDELEAALPAARLYVMYGQTEATARLSCLTPAERRAHPGSIGRGLAHSVLTVVDPAGQPVRPGVVGEIVATGPHIALGYWQAPAATERVFGGGRLRTGDLATVDQEGYITIVDRARDFLKCGGKRVSCRRIEEAVLGFGGMIEAAVVGVPDEVLGEAVCLFAVHEDGEACAVELRRFCDGNLEQALVPARIIFLASLPRNRAGKPDKPALRETVAQREKEGQR